MCAVAILSHQQTRLALRVSLPFSETLLVLCLMRCWCGAAEKVS